MSISRWEPVSPVFQPLHLCPALLVRRRQRQRETNNPLSLRLCLAFRHIYDGVVILSLWDNHLYQDTTT